MNLLVVQRILGMLLMLFSITMLPPIGVSLHYHDGNATAFIYSFISLMIIGALVWIPARKQQRELRWGDGFLVVALFWIVLGVAGAAPLALSLRPNISLTDAVFEAVSGFTTTSATTLTHLDELPRSILYYRHQIQWLGGIGMVVLAVALLPMLGIGGMQLLKAETPGQVKETRLTPRITETAKALWLVYVLITAACAGCYWAAGMTPFDAIGHSFSTVSTGGFSSHDAGLGYFNNPTIEFIAIFFMFLGGINFSLHFIAWRQLSLRTYLRDSEWRVYAGVLIVGVALFSITLIATGTFSDDGYSVRSALFHVMSMLTTTGFETTDITVWPGALPVMLVLVTFMGGCVGSSAGGMKVIRWMLMWKQGTREVNRLIHPNAVFAVKLGGRPVPWRVIDAVWGFFSIYVVCFAVLMVLLIATGVDQVSAFSAIAACINNAGPGLGSVASNFSSISEPGKWICVLAMILGRLEVYPLIVLITPAFWRR